MKPPSLNVLDCAEQLVIGLWSRGQNIHLTPDGKKLGISKLKTGDENIMWCVEGATAEVVWYLYQHGHPRWRLQ